MMAPAEVPPVPELLECLADEAHLWLVPLRDSIPPRLEQQWRRFLTPEEEVANRRFLVEDARRQHLAARALVRTTLSRYVEVEPDQWRFRQGPQGRPEIDAPADLPPLRFNLSHTRGLVACLITLGLDSGVDVERQRREIRDPLALARHSFAPAEQRALELLSGRALRERFCDLWTLKEAYVKARGAGFLSLPASRFAYAITSGGTLTLTIEPELADRAEDWQSLLMAPTRQHRLAVAIRRRRRRDLSLVVRDVRPGREEARLVRPEILGRSAAAAGSGGAELRQEEEPSR
jgi:4'-phosphopantetheinyl transferase